MIGSDICQNTLKPYEIVSYLFKNGTFFAINGIEQNIWKLFCNFTTPKAFFLERIVNVSTEIPAGAPKNR